MTARCLIMVMLVALQCGCQTWYSRERQVSDARLQTDLRNLSADIERLESRMEEMALGREDLYRRIEALEARLAEQDRVRQADLDAINAKLTQIESARMADRQALISELSAKMAAMLKSAGGQRTARTATGYEHTVKPGETLSEIAAAYDTTTRAIIEANEITNPNSIRAGQVLFIPE